MLRDSLNLHLPWLRHSSTPTLTLIVGLFSNLFSHALRDSTPAVSLLLGESRLHLLSPWLGLGLLYTFSPVVRESPLHLLSPWLGLPLLHLLSPGLGDPPLHLLSPRRWGTHLHPTFSRVEGILYSFILHPRLRDSWLSSPSLTLTGVGVRVGQAHSPHLLSHWLREFHIVLCSLLAVVFLLSDSCVLHFAQCLMDGQIQTNV